MAHSNNADLNQFWELYSARNTARIQAEGQAIDPDQFYGSKRGYETFHLALDQLVTATGTGQLKAGTPVKIVDRWMQNGYARYLDGTGLVHHADDLTA